MAVARISMVNMLMRVVDIGLAVLLSALDVAVLAALWFAEGMRQWAAQGQTVPSAATRVLQAEGVGAAVLTAASYGLFRADMPVACASQALIAALLALMLILSAGTICGRRARSWHTRRRLRRARRRWHESQREGNGHTPPPHHRHRPR
ncbi:DUF6234 family protein [Streptomyces sp. NPDC052051]|uniref:DUF6234 family protein n=1 Tax=Streptomyces sp. NPDC052051 TaxID=3154649 RepID=UPI0034168C50